MFGSSLPLEDAVAWRRDALLREAAAERLARAARRPSVGARARVAGVLHALATRLDPERAATCRPGADRPSPAPAA